MRCKLLSTTATIHNVVMVYSLGVGGRSRVPGEAVNIMRTSVTAHNSLATTALSHDSAHYVWINTMNVRLCNGYVCAHSVHKTHTVCGLYSLHFNLCIVLFSA